jgi:hypothetical protein
MKMSHDGRKNSRNRAISFVSLTLLIAGTAIGDHAIAQEPVYLQDAPTWNSSAANQTTTLWPTTANVGIGVSKPVARMQVLGTEIAQTPGSGYLVLGSEKSLHMQIDRNEIRVSGPSEETVGALYLQRLGGPISIHSSQDVSQRIVFPAEGGLAVGTTDPYTFAVDEGLQLAHWERPNAALAVAGHIYTQIVVAHEGRFQERLRVGPRGNHIPAGAWDTSHSDAVAMIGGKLTAHEIVVHIDHWADDVFSDDYELRSLESTKAFIEANHHLPDVPSEAEVQAKGVDLAEMNAVLLRKVEELTLHAIAQQDRIDALEAKIDARD